MRLELPSFDERSSLQWRLVVAFSRLCLPRHFNNFSSTSKVVLSMELMPARQRLLFKTYPSSITFFISCRRKQSHWPVLSVPFVVILSLLFPYEEFVLLLWLSLSYQFLSHSLSCLLLWLRWTQTHSLLCLIFLPLGLFLSSSFCMTTRKKHEQINVQIEKQCRETTENLKRDRERTEGGGRERREKHWQEMDEVEEKETGTDSRENSHQDRKDPIHEGSHERSHGGRDFIQTNQTHLQ